MLEIQSVTAVDAARLAPLLLEQYQYYSAEPVGYSLDQLEDYIRQRMFSEYSGIKVVAAYQGNQMLGFASFAILYPVMHLSGQMFMKDLFVSAHARGQKVGQRIMKHLARLALQQGCSRLDWTAESNNPTAGEFYDAIGAQLLTVKQYYRFENEALRQFADSDCSLKQT